MTEGAYFGTLVFSLEEIRPLLEASNLNILYNKNIRNLPYITVILVTVNVILFLLCTFTGDLLYNIGRFGVMDLMHGKYQSLFFSMFLHGDIRHLANNMLILFGLGTMLETEIGHVRFTAFYMISGLCGNLVSAAMDFVTGNYGYSIGASGAVFGLDGVLLALVLFSNKKLPYVTVPRVLFMVAYSIYSGFTYENIDNAAHIGGVLGGFVLTYFYILKNNIRKQ